MKQFNHQPTHHQTSNNKTRQIAQSGLLVTLALVASYIEFLIPITMTFPGMKLGLANGIIIIALYKYGAKSALLINVLRILLAGFLFGSLFSIAYSLSGALCSFLIMIILKNTKIFSIAGVSMAGGVFHNLGQLIVAMALVESVDLVYYFPVLLFSGLITGLVLGILSTIVLHRLKSL